MIGTAPPLVLSVCPTGDRVRDTVIGLIGGADGFNTKPFRSDDLLARMRVRLRGGRAAEPTLLRVGDVALDLRARQAIVVGRAVGLTAREFALAEVLWVPLDL